MDPRRSSGQAMVEFALIAPLFFALLFAIIEFGRMVYIQQMLNNSAREGARYAIVHGAATAQTGCPSGPLPPDGSGATPPNACDPYGDNVKQAVRQWAIAVIDSSGTPINISAKWCVPDDGDISTPYCPDTNAYLLGDGHNGRGQAAQVEIDYQYRPLIAGVFEPLNGIFVNLPIFTIRGESTLVINH